MLYSVVLFISLTAYTISFAQQNDILETTVLVDGLLNFNREQPINNVQPFSCASLQGTNVGTCSPYQMRFIDSVLNGGVAKYFLGGSVWKNCTSVSYSNSPQLSLSELTKIYNNFFLQDKTALTEASILALKNCVNTIEPRLKSKKIDRNEFSKVMLANMANTSWAATDMASKHLMSIYKLDAATSNQPLNDIDCNRSGNEATNTICNNIKKCNISNDIKLDSYVDLAMSTLSIITRNDDTIKTLSDSIPSDDEIITAHGQTKEEVLQAKETLKLLKQQNEDLKMLTPWMYGNESQSKTKKILKSLNNTKEQDIKSSIRAAILEQFKADRAAHLSEFDKNNTLIKCVRGDYSSCAITNNILNKQQDRVSLDRSKVKLGLVDGDYSKVLSAENDLIRLKCAKDLATITNEFNEDLLYGSFTAASLLVGGGAVKASATALGRIVSGLGLMVKGGMYAGEAYMGYKLFQDVKKVCESTTKLQGDEQENVNTNCSEISEYGGSLVRDISECIKGIGLLSIPTAISLKGIIKPKKSNSIVAGQSKDVPIAVAVNDNVLTNSVNQLKLSPKDNEEILQLINGLAMDKKNTELIGQIISTNVTDAKSINVLKNYLSYMNSLNKKSQMNAWQDLELVLKQTEEYPNGSYAAKFFAKEKKFSFYEETMAYTNEKSLSLSKNQPKEEIHTIARDMARTQRGKLQRTYYGCSSRKMTPQHAKTGKLFKRVSMAMGLGSIAYGYTATNNDKEKNLEWFGKLGYDIGLTYLTTRLTSNIMSKPGSGPIDKYIQVIAGQAKIGTVDATIYSALYDVTQEEAEEKLRRIESSPNYKDEIARLDAYINSNNIIEKFKATIIENYKKIITLDDKDELLGENPVIDGIDLGKLTLEQLKNPDVQDKLVAATLNQMYSQNSGLLQFGSKGLDKFIYDRSWNMFIGVPKNLALGAAMYFSICMSGDAPAVGISTAIGIHTLNQFISSDYFYDYRRKIINQ